MRLSFFLAVVAVTLAVATSGSSEEVCLLDSLEKEIIKIVKEATPAIVSITTEPLPPRWWKNFKDEEYPDWVKNFFESDITAFKRTSTGTGFIIDPDGHILTTEDVIGEAQEVTVSLPDGRELPARVMGKNVPFNVALLKVEGEDFPFLPLKKSDGVKAGSWVITLGRPFGLSISPSWGIVSGLGRSGLGIAPYEELIQITAPVNPGDSGGPVLNSKGEVIGVIAGSFSGFRELEFDLSFIRRFHQSFPRAKLMSPGNLLRPSQAQGIGFAIPIKLAQEAVAGFQEGKKAGPGWVGIEIKEVALPSSAGKDGKGVLIGSVFPGSPAEKASLQKGDIILSLDGQPLKSPRDLQKTILLSGIGKTVELEVIRQGERRTVTVAIEGQPSD